MCVRVCGWSHIWAARRGNSNCVCFFLHIQKQRQVWHGTEWNKRSREKTIKWAKWTRKMTYENYRADTKKGGRTPKEKINVKLHRMYTQSEGEREREKQRQSGTAWGRWANKRIMSLYEKYDNKLCNDEMMVSLNDWWIWRVQQSVRQPASQSVNERHIHRIHLFRKIKFLCVHDIHYVCRKIHFYLYACITRSRTNNTVCAVQREKNAQ